MSDQEVLGKCIEKYDCNEQGQVWSKKRPEVLLTTSKDRAGYWYFSVYMGNGISKKVKVHRFVAYKYLPNPEKLPHVNHKNGVRDDNRVENLEWCTAAYNVQDGFKRGRVTWQTGHASPSMILRRCEETPRLLMWLLSESNFKWAKSFFGEKMVAYATLDSICHQCKSKNRIAVDLMPAWQYHIQQLALAEDRIAYLRTWLEEQE